MIIGRKQFDKVGIAMREWLEEEGFEVNVRQELDLLNLILSELGIEYNSSKK